MIDVIYNYRQRDIHSAVFSDDFNKLCIPFEESLTEARLTTFHKHLDCVSDTAAAEMRAVLFLQFLNTTQNIVYLPLNCHDLTFL